MFSSLGAHTERWVTGIPSQLRSGSGQAYTLLAGSFPIDWGVRYHIVRFKADGTREVLDTFPVVLTTTDVTAILLKLRDRLVAEYGASEMDGVYIMNNGGAYTSGEGTTSVIATLFTVLRLASAPTPKTSFITLERTTRDGDAYDALVSHDLSALTLFGTRTQAFGTAVVGLDSHSAAFTTSTSGIGRQFVVTRLSKWPDVTDWGLNPSTVTLTPTVTLTATFESTASEVSSFRASVNNVAPSVYADRSIVRQTPGPQVLGAAGSPMTLVCIDVPLDEISNSFAVGVNNSVAGSYSVNPSAQFLSVVHEVLLERASAVYGELFADVSDISYVTTKVKDVSGTELSRTYVPVFRFSVLVKEPIPRAQLPGDLPAVRYDNRLRFTWANGATHWSYFLAPSELMLFSGRRAGRDVPLLWVGRRVGAPVVGTFAAFVQEMVLTRFTAVPDHLQFGYGQEQLCMPPDRLPLKASKSEAATFAYAQGQKFDPAPAVVTPPPLIVEVGLEPAIINTVTVRKESGTLVVSEISYDSGHIPKEVNMSGMTLDKLYEKVFLESPDKKLRLVIPGHKTGRKIGFHKTARPTIRGAWIEKLNELPLETVADITARMQARPVFLIPGRDGKAALLVGSHDWTDPVAANNVGFRSWQLRPMTDVIDKSVSMAPSITDGEADFFWKFGADAMQYLTSYIVSDWGWTYPPELREYYHSCCLGQGVSVMVRYDSTSSIAGTVVRMGRANGPLTPDVGIGGAKQAGRYFVFSNTGEPRNFAASSSQFSPGWTRSGGVPAFNAADQRLAPDQVHLGLVCKPLADLLEVTVGVGSSLPLALVSKRIGWATGFPHDTGPIMLEIAEIAASATVNDLKVSWSSVDLTGAQYKRLFPVATLPSDKQEAVSATLTELSDTVWFRTAMNPRGFTYADGMSYDQTQLAVDVKKADGSLDELFFEALDAELPPVSYLSLGAKSKVAIAKGRNTFITTVLAADAYTFVSTTPINFVKTNGTIYATQNSLNLTNGEALIAVKSGAPVTAAAPLTLEEVAVGFFLMPTWAAVIATAEETGEARRYLVDENANSNDLRFNYSSDETARALPLLLGFDRFDFSCISGPLALGITTPELA